jgi:hypothetical protein
MDYVIDAFEHFMAGARAKGMAPAGGAPAPMAR